MLHDVVYDAAALATAEAVAAVFIGAFVEDQRWVLVVVPWATGLLECPRTFQVVTQPPCHLRDGDGIEALGVEMFMTTVHCSVAFNLKYLTFA